MSDPNQDPHYRSRSHRPPASSQTTNQSAYSSSHPGQPVYTPYPGGAQEFQLPGPSSSYSTSGHAPGGHTPHVPFPEPPQSLQSRPAEYPEAYPSHSSTTPYSTQVAQDPYDSVGYQASGHAQGGHTPRPSFPVQPQRQRSVPRQSEPRGPQEDYSAPSQTSPPLAGASPQGSYGYGGHQTASHAQGGHIPHHPYYSPPSHTSPHLTGATTQDSYSSGGYQSSSHAMEGRTSHSQLPISTSLFQHSHGSAGPSASHLYPSHTTPYSTAGPYQQGGQDLRRYPHAGGSSGNQNMSAYGTGSSATGSTAPHPPSGVRSSVTAPHTQGGGTGGSGSGGDPGGDRDKAPPSHPTGTHSSMCRFTGCFKQTFFDRRVNELREWCSDQHMIDAITNGMERRCKQCNVWPRRYGSKYCSGAVCKYPGY